MTDNRPEPEALLTAVRKEGRGKLRIFLGAAPGVGKTYSMLTEAIRRHSRGEDVVIVRGTAEDLGTPAQAGHVVTALSAKYTRPGDRPFLPDAEPAFDVVYAITPQSAMMWRLADYEASQRRWAS